jgi:hypothetical protein
MLFYAYFPLPVIQNTYNLSKFRTIVTTTCPMYDFKFFPKSTGSRGNSVKKYRLQNPEPICI